MYVTVERVLLFRTDAIFRYQSARLGGHAFVARAAGVGGEHQVHRHHHHFIIGTMASTSIDSHATTLELYAISKDVLTHKRCTPTFPKYLQLVPYHLTHFKPALVLLAQCLPA
jgi:hypothetical protein